MHQAAAAGGREAELGGDAHHDLGLGNPRIVRWLSQHRQEYVTEFQSVAEIESLVPVMSAAE